MKNNDLVSIIIPIYKVEKYIDNCIESLKNQTYTNLEIVLVDDGSPDSCPQKCDDYAKQDKRFKVVHKPNGGVMSAWTEGFKHSTGKFVTFVDPDDYVEPNYVEAQLSALKNADADMSICGYTLVFDNKTVNKLPCAEELSSVLENDELLKFKKNCVNQVNQYTPFYKWNKLFKRELVENNLKYCSLNVSLGDDCCVSLGSILDSNKITFVNEPLYYYVQRQTSIIHTYNKTLINQMETLLADLKQLFTDKGFYDEQAVVFEEARMLFIISRNFINSNLKMKEKKQVFKQLKTTVFATHLKQQKSISYLPRTYKIFVKIFLTGSFMLTFMGIKAFKIMKRLKQKLK